MSDQPQETPVPTPEQLSTTATAGPQLSTALAGGPATPASAPATAGAGTAAAPALAPAQPQAPPQAPQITPQIAAAVATEQHHSRLGKIWNALTSQTQYVPGPDGAPVPVQRPQSGTDLFRHILAGAILGGAAGADASSKGQGGGGQFMAGANASLEANQRADEQRRALAQTAFANQQAVARGQREEHTETREDQRVADERLKTAAQFEIQNREALLHERDSNLRDLDFNERHNERMEMLRDKATEAGAVDAPIPHNGEPNNGKSFERLFTTQPELFKAPEGYNRLVTTDTDMNGLTWNSKLGYVDATGKAIDLKDRTSWHVQYLPSNAAKEPIEVKGSDLNRLMPKTAGTLLKPDKVYRLTVGEIVGLAAKEHETNRHEANDAWKYAHDETTAQLTALKDKADNYTREAIAADRRAEFDAQASADAKEFRSKAEAAYDKFDEVQKAAHPNSRLRTLDSGRNNANPKPVGVIVGQKVTLKNGKAVTVTKVNQDGTFDYK